MQKTTTKTIQDNKPRSITSIGVSGYKSIYDKIDVALRPLTILAGANSSGKSSLIQPLLLLKQTLENQGDPGPLLLNGPNVRFTRTDQLLSKGSKGKFDIQIKLNTGEYINPCFIKKSNGLDLYSMGFSSSQSKGIIKTKMSQDEIKNCLPESVKDFDKQFSAEGERVTKWHVVRERCFFDIEVKVGDQTPFGIKIGELIYTFIGDFATNIKNVIHVPGLRGNPSRTYPRMACGPDYPGTFEIYTASIIADWQAKKDKRLPALVQALKKMGLTSQVKIEPLDDTQIEVKVGRLPQATDSKNDLVNIADVGFGVSQTLPILVALLVAKSGQIVYLEQPEIHLHPRAQREFAKILMEAANRGVITVVETHSAILLRTIQTLVATGKLFKKDVAMHWLSRNKQGTTKLRTADMDDSGAYGDWPEDFGDIELDVEQAYLDAVEQRGAKK